MLKRKFILLLFWTLPTLAQVPARSKPERVFESLWQTFHQNYASFEMRHVNWQETYQTYRPQVSAATTDADLLRILTEMVEPLRDGHISISKTGDLPASAKYSAFHQRFPTKAAIDSLRGVTLHTLAGQGFTPLVPFKSKQYKLGGYCQNANYGYLQLNGFGGMSLPDFVQQIDEFMSRAQSAKALLIDVRINGGGSPEFVNALVSRLLTTRLVASYGQRKIGSGAQAYTPLQPYYYEASTSPLRKPVVLLTSGASISAADHFAMGLKGLDFVTIIGENTGGMFSSMMGAKLPNGWEFSLSNERYLSRDSICYEAVGVPVDIKAANDRNDLRSDNDAVLRIAIEFLDKKLVSK